MTGSTLAYIGPDRQLHTVRADGTQPTQLTLSPAANPLLRWGQPDVASTAYSWPTWSPDGQRLACFSHGLGDDVQEPASVHVVEADGLREYQLGSFPGAMPLYAQWQPDGQGVAVLTQDGTGLELVYGRLDQLGRMRAMDQGSPLFFTWGPNGRRLFIHTGPTRPDGEGRLVVRDSLGQLPDEALPQAPGNYCSPVIVNGRLVHVARSGQVNSLISTDLSGGDARTLMEFDGLGAVVAAPALDGVIFSTAANADGAPYRGTTLLPLDGGRSQRLCDDDCLAFTWSEAGRQLLYARVPEERRRLAWHSVRPGEVPVERVRFWPTQEMRFSLHFFEQFSASHRFVSADGQHLLFCGHPDDQLPDRGPPGIYVLDLRRDDPPRLLAQGSFACFAPSDGV